MHVQGPDRRRPRARHLRAAQGPRTVDGARRDRRGTTRTRTLTLTLTELDETDETDEAQWLPLLTLALPLTLPLTLPFTLPLTLTLTLTLAQP